MPLGLYTNVGFPSGRLVLNIYEKFILARSGRAGPNCRLKVSWLLSGLLMVDNKLMFNGWL